MITYPGTGCTYVQAWSISGPWSGIVYTQEIMLQKFGTGCDAMSLTIVRHDNGDREYLPGTIAAAVCQYREPANVTR